MFDLRKQKHKNRKIRILGDFDSSRLCVETAYMRACLMLILLGGWGLCIGSMAEAQVEIQPVAGIDAQPLKAQIKRLVQALEFLGQPLPQATQAALWGDRDRLLARRTTAAPLARDADRRSRSPRGTVGRP